MYEHQMIDYKGKRQTHNGCKGIGKWFFVNIFYEMNLLPLNNGFLFFLFFFFSFWDVHINEAIQGCRTHIHYIVNVWAYSIE